MEGGEINNFIKIWLTIIVSLCYCYGLSKIVQKGFKRLLFILPIVSLFFYLPLPLYSIHLGGFTAFYIVWLGNFKLLLFAFGQGPLCSNPSISLPHFVAVSCLPIKLQGNPKPLKSQPNAQFIDQNPNPYPNGQNNENPSSKLHLNGLNRDNSSPKPQLNGQPIENSLKLHLNGLKRENPLPKSQLNGQNGQTNENPSPKLHQNGLKRENTFQQNGQTKENPSPKLHQNGLKRENTCKQNGQNGEFQSLTKNDQMTRGEMKTWYTSYAMKGVLLGILVKAYDYNEYYHPKMMLLIHQVHIYFLLDLIFAMSAIVARRVLGLELEPQFKDPYLATSLQDFWGKRWNLTVTSILRPTVYEPTLKAFSCFVGKKAAMLAAVFNTFMVSGLMHEILLYYIGRSTPTWGVTCFFLLHGGCTAVEIGLKTAFQGSGFELPLWISRSLTLLFVIGTSVWMFLPEYKKRRVDVRAFEEYAAVGALAKVVFEKIAARFRVG